MSQRYYVETWPNVPQLKQARAEIAHMPLENFDRYDSLFEAKLTLRDKSGRFVERFSLNAWCSIMEELESNDWLERVSALFGAELVADRWRHYAGVFRYLPGDYLGVHVDAGIHPIAKLRKHVTAVLYFGKGGGPLELWAGTRCADFNPEPAVDYIVDSIEPGLGMLVLFENNDYAWHAARRNDSDEDRIVMTVSYLSAEIDRFANRRQRAFFVPRPDEEWAPETYRLRDLRADPERYAEAYHG